MKRTFFGLVTGLLIFVALLIACSIYSLSLPPKAPAQCPERSPAQLEASVENYWHTKRGRSGTMAQAQEFFREHAFLQEDGGYIYFDGFWRVPFTMVTVRTGIKQTYFAMVSCHGNVELMLGEMRR